MKKNIFSLIGTTLVLASIQQAFATPISPTNTLNLSLGKVLLKRSQLHFSLLIMTTNQLITDGTVSRPQGLTINDLNDNTTSTVEPQTDIAKNQLGIKKGGGYWSSTAS